MKKAWILIFMISVGFLSPELVSPGEVRFPSRPVEVIVPSEAGGVLDMAARIVADQLAKELKGSVVVIDKPGASGTRGTDSVVKAKPDGHTILAAQLMQIVLVNFFMDSVPYDSQKDLIPLAYVGESPSLLVVKSSSPWKTFKEMVDYARANPGKLTYSAASGLASTSTMNMELIKSREGIDIQSVVYEGGGPAIVALVGGHVHMTSAAYPPLQPHIASGTLRPLATSKKIDELPNVPTFKDLGFPEVLINWSGFFAPAKIPGDVQKRLVDALDKAMENPQTIEKLKKAGFAPEMKTPAAISEMVKQQFGAVAKITKKPLK